MLLINATIDNDELEEYLNYISDSYGISNNYQEIINILYDRFNITVTLEQLEEYYSPNAREYASDLKLQYAHLGLV